MKKEAKNPEQYRNTHGNMFQNLWNRLAFDKKKEFVVQVDVGQIRPNTSQPRQDFEVNSIVQLADSIRQYGILQPLTVRKCEGTDGYRYELIAGERRLRAAKMLGMKTVPCLISDVDDTASAELALVENMIRENLNMFDQATAFSTLSTKFGLTQEEIARKLSISQSAVANKIRLLKLSAEERKQISEANLTERHARSFLRITNKALRARTISEVIAKGYNVADTEKYIQDVLNTEVSRVKKAQDAKKKVILTADVVCSNIDRYVDKLCSVSNLVSAEKKIVGENTVITLTVKKEVG